MEQRNYEKGKQGTHTAKENRKKYQQKIKAKKKLMKLGAMLLLANQILAMSAGAVVDDYLEKQKAQKEGTDFIKEKFKDLPNVYYQPSDIGGTHLMVDGLSIAKFSNNESISKEQAIPYIIKEMEKIDPNVTLAEKYIIALDLVEGNKEEVEKHLGKISKEEMNDVLLFNAHMSAIREYGGVVDYENESKEHGGMSK